MVQAVLSRLAAVLLAAALSGCALVTPRPTDLAARMQDQVLVVTYTLADAKTVMTLIRTW